MNSYFFSSIEIAIVMTLAVLAMITIGTHPLPIFDGVHKKMANVCIGFAIFGIAIGYIFYKDMELKHDIEIRKILGEFRDLEIKENQKERLARRRDELLYPEKYVRQEPAFRSTGRRGGRHLSENEMCERDYEAWRDKVDLKLE